MEYFEEENIEEEEKLEEKFPEKETKRRLRRKEKRLAKKRLKKIADNNPNYPGPYVADDGRIKNPGRGKFSKWLKRKSNEKVRNTEDIGNGGNYKKTFDYWWEIS